MRGILTCVLFVAVLSSCSPTLTPFTKDLYENHEWTQADLQNIQFYLSDDIVLRRQVKRGKTEIISGDIKILDGQEIEEVVIRAGTPGVFVFSPKAERFAISFEEGDDRYLMFGPNPRRGGKFVLLGSNWSKRKGEVSYDNKTFYTASESSIANLMVDLKAVRDVQVKSRRASGRVVKG